MTGDKPQAACPFGRKTEISALNQALTPESAGWRVDDLRRPCHRRGLVSHSDGLMGGVDDKMIKSQLIQKLADENPHLYQRDVERIVSAVFEEITDALARGDRVELRGFGAFSVKHRDARVGRNPRTGESVEVPQKRVPFFKTGKDLRDRMNS